MSVSKGNKKLKLGQESSPPGIIGSTDQEFSVSSGELSESQKKINLLKELSDKHQKLNNRRMLVLNLMRNREIEKKILDRKDKAECGTLASQIYGIEAQIKAIYLDVEKKKELDRQTAAAKEKVAELEAEAKLLDKTEAEKRAEELEKTLAKLELLKARADAL